MNSYSYTATGIRWIKPIQAPDHDNLPDYLRKFADSITFFNSCIFGPLTISIGDFVLISNADAHLPESLDSCNIGEVLRLYEKVETDENKEEDLVRAIVQWYSRPKELPKKAISEWEIDFDDKRDLIKDLRPFRADISIETIFNKCEIITGPETMNAGDIIGKRANRERHPVFACRYKLIKKGRKYIIHPVDQFDMTAKTPLKKVEPPKTPKSSRKDQMYAVVKSTEKRQKSVYGSDSVVSPIKIVKMSTVTDASKRPIAPRIKNCSIHLTPIKNFEQEYMLVNTDNGSEELKMKLTVEKKEQSVSPTSNIENIIPVRRDTRKRSQTATSEMVLREIENNLTPRKTRRQSIDFGTPKSATTIVTRRRSILKTPGGTPNAGTPKRNIQLSNIVEEFPHSEMEHRTPQRKSVYRNYVEMISPPEEVKTPSRSGRKKKLSLDNETEVSTPKSSKKDPQTPKSTRTPASRRKLLREGLITPTLANREFNVNRRKSDLQLTRERLHVSAVPKSLPCRESEYENIYSYLVRKIEDQSGGCMYISGVPGTGKTATVTEVVRTLKNEFSDDDGSDFDYLEINGLRLTEPQQAYVQIYRQITGKTLPWKQAYTLLQKRFMTPSHKRLPTILLIDELDIICNRRQDVVYNLLDWSTKSAAKLAVITIANTMDLPERFLHGKVTSRLGLTRLTFLPYTFKQLQTIVTDRLSGSDSFDSDALQLVSRKIAAVSGDARRALDICRRATEIAEEDPSTRHVNLTHVQKALGEMISSGKIQAIKMCSKMEQLFLQAVRAEVLRTGVEECTFLSVYTQLETLAAFSGTHLPPVHLAMKMCTRLDESRLLIAESAQKDIYRKIMLNVSCDDIHFALQDADLF